mgnify:FL=1
MKKLISLILFLSFYSISFAVDKFSDIYAPACAGLSGIKIYLYNANDTLTKVDSTTTDANGLYTFSPTSSGTYKLKEATNSNWIREFDFIKTATSPYMNAAGMIGTNARIKIKNALNLLASTGGQVDCKDLGDTLVFDSTVSRDIANVELFFNSQSVIKTSAYPFIAFASGWTYHLGRSLVLGDSLNKNLIASRDTTQRYYNVLIDGGIFDNGTVDSGTAINFKNVSMGRVQNTSIRNVNIGAYVRATSGLGAYYNYFDNVEHTTVKRPYQILGGGNDTYIRGGRANGDRICVEVDSVS